MAKNDTLKTASVLAFERKLDPSDALLYASNWDKRQDEQQWQPVEGREKSVRGTISNRLKAKDQDPAKLDAQIENPNLQTVDVATLPHDADTMVARFTLRVLAGAGTPSACNNAEYQAKLEQAVAEYKQAQGFGELAHRYANNLANGRFLWRNRMGAEQVEVSIRQLAQGKATKEWTFDALSLSLRAFEDTAELKELAGVIAAAGPFDLDHLGPEFAQDGSGIGRGDESGGVEHADAGQRKVPVFSHVAVLTPLFPPDNAFGPAAQEPDGVNRQRHRLAGPGDGDPLHRHVGPDAGGGAAGDPDAEAAEGKERPRQVEIIGDDDGAAPAAFLHFRRREGGVLEGVEGTGLDNDVFGTDAGVPGHGRHHLGLGRRVVMDAA